MLEKETSQPMASAFEASWSAICSDPAAFQIPKGHTPWKKRKYVREDAGRKPVSAKGGSRVTGRYK